MKYVKIFDSQMRPLGVLQLGSELAQSEETKYVKVYDENLDKCNGVVALSDNISETDAAKRIKIYDANLILIGGSTVGEIGGGSSEATIVSISPSLPTLDGDITITMSKSVSAEDVINNLIVHATDGYFLDKTLNQGLIELSTGGDIVYSIDAQTLPNSLILLSDQIPEGGPTIDRIEWGQS